MTDLLQEYESLKKLTERNTFVVVLIDCEYLKVCPRAIWKISLKLRQFLDSYVQKGEVGGQTTAKLLRQSLFEYVRYQNDFNFDQKIIIRIFANISALTTVYTQRGAIENRKTLEDFIIGFNQAHPLNETIDAGNGRSASDIKVKRMCFWACNTQTVLI